MFSTKKSQETGINDPHRTGNPSTSQLLLSLLLLFFLRPLRWFGNFSFPGLNDSLLYTFSFWLHPQLLGDWDMATVPNEFLRPPYPQMKDWPRVLAKNRASGKRPPAVTWTKVPSSVEMLPYFIFIIAPLSPQSLRHFFLIAPIYEILMPQIYRYCVSVCVFYIYLCFTREKGKDLFGAFFTSQE